MSISTEYFIQLLNLTMTGVVLLAFGACLIAVCVAICDMLSNIRSLSHRETQGDNDDTK